MALVPLWLCSLLTAELGVSIVFFLKLKHTKTELMQLSTVLNDNKNPEKCQLTAPKFSMTIFLLRSDVFTKQYTIVQTACFQVT